MSDTGERGRGAGHPAPREAYRAGRVRPVACARGQSTIELIVLAPLLLVLVFLTLEFGRVFGSWVIVTNGAREGARFAITQTWCGNTQTTSTCSVDANIVSRVATTAQFLLWPNTALPASQQCTPTGGTASTPAAHACSCSAATLCVGIWRYTDNGTSTTGDHVVQIWVTYQVQTIAPITGAIPFFGTGNYSSTINLVGLSSMRSQQ